MEAKKIIQFIGLAIVVAAVTKCILMLSAEPRDSYVFFNFKGSDVWFFYVLAVVGFLGGVACSLPFWLVGLAVISPLPIAASIEIVIKPTTHNLYGVEIFSYLILYLPISIGGAWLGKLLKRAIAPR